MARRLPELGGLKVCLVFPPYRESEDIVFLTAAKKNLGKIPPLSLCAVAAALEQYGCSVKIIDANVTDSGIDQVISEISRFSPDFLGFTLATYQFHFTLEWIRNIRQKINVPVIVGGHHARIYPREILTHREIDYCIIGDAEEALPKFLIALTGKQDLSGILGLAYRNESSQEIIVNNAAACIEDLDSVTFPSRHLIDNSLYYSLISQYKNFTAMTTSRGCVFQCIFCDNHCLKYRAMSPKRVVDEIEACHRDFGINEIDMFDGVFSINKNRLLAICEEIGKRKIRIHWSMRTRADLVDRDMLIALKQAGCIRIYYGIESGSALVLKNIKKGMDLGYIEETVKFTKKIGIDTFGYFMLGAPGETKETLRQTRKLMLSLPLDYVQISPIFYPPNTELYTEVMKKIKYDYWQEYTLDPEKMINFPIVGTDFSQAQIHFFVRKMYLNFYLRPRYILKFMMRIKSYAEISRALKALSDMVRGKI